MREVPGSNPGATTIFPSPDVPRSPKTRIVFCVWKRTASSGLHARPLNAAPGVGATFGERQCLPMAPGGVVGSQAMRFNFALSLFAVVSAATLVLSGGALAVQVVATERAVEIAPHTGASDIAGDHQGAYLVATAGAPLFTGTQLSAYLSTNLGRDWSSAQPVYTTPPGQFVQPGQILVSSVAPQSWLLAWVEQPDLSSCCGEASLLISRTIDNGANWSSPVVMATSTNDGHGLHLRGVIGGADGTVLLWWTKYDQSWGGEMGAISHDSGATWTPTNGVGPQPPLGGVFYLPLIISRAADSTWLAVAQHFQDGIGVVTLASASTDGIVWGALHEIHHPFGFSNGALAGAGSGRWMFISDYPGPFAYITTDNGLSWSEVGKFDSTPPIPGVFPVDFRLFYDAASDAWSALWNRFSSTPGPRGAWYARSFDNGATWSRNAAFNPNASGEYISLASDSQGNIVEIRLFDETLAATISAPKCPPSPPTTCFESSSRASLKVSNREGAGDVVDFKLSMGAGDPTAVVHDPTLDSNFRLCVHDSTSGMLLYEGVIDAEGQCGDTACWSTSESGYELRDKRNAVSSIRTVKIQTSGGQLSKVSVRAAGYATSPPRLPFVDAASLNVQFHDMVTGACWSKGMVVGKNSEIGASAR